MTQTTMQLKRKKGTDLTKHSESLLDQTSPSYLFNTYLHCICILKQLK